MSAPIPLEILLGHAPPRPVPAAAAVRRVRVLGINPAQLPDIAERKEPARVIDAAATRVAVHAHLRAHGPCSCIAIAEALELDTGRVANRLKELLWQRKATYRRVSRTAEWQLVEEGASC